jgi:hypothetical protein
MTQPTVKAEAETIGQCFRDTPKGVFLIYFLLASKQPPELRERSILDLK